MIVGIKDGLKLFGVAIVCACAVFVCTFFLNYYLDCLALEDIPAESVQLYNAQQLSAKLTCLITGGVLAVIAVFLVAFYTGLFIEERSKIIGALKAMGYPNGTIALRFWVFGLSVLLGTAVGHGLGYALAPTIYSSMSDGFLEVPLHYHIELTAGLVIAPTVVFSFVAVLCAYLKLRVPVMQLLRGKAEKAKTGKAKDNERSFLWEMFFRTPTAHKALAFFVALAGFCFATMMQMSWSMTELNDTVTMGVVMLVIGVVLSATTFLLAMTSLTRGNAKTVSLMKAYGYNFWEYGNAVFGGFRLFAYIGFAVGTGYQYGLLRLMVDLVFNNVENMPEYSFNVPCFFITLASFIVVYELAVLYFNYRIGKENVRKYVSE
ncbi:MAG: ABC transporter permease [Clostridia bacterium]|nr:ABC transporter permease [Clostridia bacterium]